MRADFPWALFAAVAIVAICCVVRPQPGDEPALTAEVRTVSEPEPELPDVSTQLNAQDAEVLRFAAEIAPDLLLEFEVDGWRRSA